MKFLQLMKMVESSVRILVSIPNLMNFSKYERPDKLIMDALKYYCSIIYKQYDSVLNTQLAYLTVNGKT